LEQSSNGKHEARTNEAFPKKYPSSSEKFSNAIANKRACKDNNANCSFVQNSGLIVLIRGIVLP
jgi:hypothetical protein